MNMKDKIAARLQGKRRTVVILILVIAALVAFAAFNSLRAQPLQGYVEGEYINIASNPSGVLQQLFVSRGQLVKASQLLYQLDQEPEASQFEQAKQQLAQAESILSDLENGQRSTVLDAIQAQLAQAQANLKLSTVTLDRNRTLYAQNAISKAALDQAEANYQHDLNLVNQYSANLADAKLGARNHIINSQRAVVLANTAAVQRALWQLHQKTAYAPAAGLIFDTYYRPGEFVNSQQPVMALLTPANVKLIFYVAEPDRSKIHIGEKVQFTCDGCNKTFSATINYLSPQAEYTPPVIFSRESRTKLVYRVEAALAVADAERLHPGQPVDVYLVNS
jgi:HlyD family secretion protein